MERDPGRKLPIEIREELERRANLKSIVAQVDEVESDSAIICSTRRRVRAAVPAAPCRDQSRGAAVLHRAIPGDRACEALDL